MNIAGLDVSRNWAIVCILSSFPDVSPTQFFKTLNTAKDWNKVKGSRQINECMYRLECDKSGIDLLASLDVSDIILEPTGYWYSGFWVHTASKLSIKINWISHQELAKSRGHYKFKNKSDLSDALTLALVYFDKGTRNEFGELPFLKHYNHDLIDQVRRLFFEREQQDKMKGAIGSQIRQRLCLEFPEVAQKNFEYIGKHGINPTLGHLICKIKNPRIPTQTSGTGVSEYTKLLIQDYLIHTKRIFDAEAALTEMMQHPEFRAYLTVFNHFGYGIVLKSLLLIHCYPLDRFLLNGIPYRKGSHDLSLRKFQSFLGFSFHYESSGDGSAKSNKVKKSWAGSDIVRCHLYAHALATICIDNKPAKSQIQQKLKDAWLDMRIDPQTGQTSPSFKSLGKDGICRLLFYETRLLYQELRKMTFESYKR